MNKQIFILIFSAVLFFQSCKKDETDNVSKVVNVSYPLITLKGAPADSIIVLPAGSAYVDAGAVLTDDISGATSDITGSTAEVDVNTPGVYSVVFSAANANGFETVKKRVIVIYDTSSVAEDYSGNYSHATGELATVTKVADRIFQCDDLYGTFTIPIPLYPLLISDGLLFLLLFSQVM